MKEFIEFAKEIRLNIGKFTIDEIYKKIDVDKSGKIEFNEFLNYMEELTSAKEFQVDYDYYSGEKGYMNINDIIAFFKDIQKQENFEIYNF